MRPWLPWATRNQSMPGTTYHGTGGRKLLLHSTETRGLPSYNYSHPHFTFDLWHERYWQHVPLDRASYALKSPGHPRSPNRNAGLVVQIELIGYARDIPDYDDVWYDRLAERLALLAVECDVPLDMPFDFIPSWSGATRVGWHTYRDATGVVGHQHVPFNDHWDPGGIDTKLAPRLGGDWFDMATKDELRQVVDEALAAAIPDIATRVNGILGDFDNQGDQRHDAGDRGDARLRQVERVVRRIEDHLTG